MPDRIATPRRYLMCRPEFFTVNYSINPWMDPGKPVDTALAVAQWEDLRQLHIDLGRQVELIDPIPGLPDMVYAANGATVVDGRVYGARFLHEERRAEGPAYLDWFRANGFADADILDAREVNEGEGDLLAVGDDLILAGTGFRTTRAAHDELAAFFGRRVVGLELVDPRYYHLDTALCVLGEEIAYYPPAFSAASQAVLAELFPHALLAAHEDAAAFGLNAVCDGRHVILPAQAADLALARQLRQHGFEPIGIDLSELLKGGGSAKCCTLELRPRPGG